MSTIAEGRASDDESWRAWAAITATTADTRIGRRLAWLMVGSNTRIRERTFASLGPDLQMAVVNSANNQSAARTPANGAEAIIGRLDALNTQVGSLLTRRRPARPRGKAVAKAREARTSRRASAKASVGSEPMGHRGHRAPARMTGMAHLHARP